MPYEFFLTIPHYITIFHLCRSASLLDLKAHQT